MAEAAASVDISQSKQGSGTITSEQEIVYN